MNTSLLPLSKLNAALVSVGLSPRTDKQAAVDAVDRLILDGRLTIDQVRNSAGIEVADSLSEAVASDMTVRANQTLARTEELASKVTGAVDTLLVFQKDLTDRFKTLSNDLASKAKPDEQAVSREIAQQVSALFDRFRESVTPEQVKQIANTVPVVRSVLAKDLFTETSYESDGENVNFGDLPVQVWDDPQAPQVVDDYVFNPAHLHQALIALDDPLPDNVWLAGERGTGKTEFVSQLAARLKRRLFRVNFDEALERSDFIGGNTIESGSVVWKPGVIAQAISHPGAIVLLDEIGFARAQSLAILHSLCERSPHRSITIAETGERIPVASHVVFFGADNSNGHGDSTGNFAGVREQNTAFLDRFSFTLRFEYLKPVDEIALVSKRTGLPSSATEHLVRFVNVAREKARTGLLTQPPSLRQLFAWARAVKRGVPVRSAFESAIVNKFPSDVSSELEALFASQINIESFKHSL